MLTSAFMKAPSESPPDNDANSEAWFQKGLSVLEIKKQEREFEERLKKEMAHPALFEPVFWIGIGLLCASNWLDVIWQDAWYRLFWVLTVIVHICNALDTASQKRMKAMIEWIEHQKTKETQSK